MTGALGYQPVAMRESIVSAVLENEYLKIYASETGGFVMGTTGGNPLNELDDDHPLLYGYALDPIDIGSSFTTLRVDGEDKVLGCNIDSDWQDEEDCLYPSLSPQLVENKIITNWVSQGNISIEEQVSFVTNPLTGREDLVSIVYTLLNNSGESKEVGLRILYDTDIRIDEANDAPLMVPGIGLVAKEREWLGESVPEYWQTFENSVMQEGGMVVRGQLRGNGATTPDRLIFANFFIGIDLWNMSITPTLSIIDGAVFQYFNPQALGAGATRTITILYGLGEIDFSQIYLPLILK